MAVIRFVGTLVIIRTLFLNQTDEFYLNNRIHICLLTPQIIACYTHKMVIVS